MIKTISNINLKTIKQSFCLSKILSSLFVGVSLSWFLFFMFRCFWDMQNPIFLSEFWILILFNIFVFHSFFKSSVNTADKNKQVKKKVAQEVHKNIYDDYIEDVKVSSTSISTPKNKLTEIIFVILFSLVGVFLVFLWHLQVMQRNIEFKTSVEQQHFINSSSIISSMIEDSKLNCDKSSDFMDRAVLNNLSWKMSIYEKLLIKDKVVDMYRKNCINDVRFFNIIRNLEIRPLKENIKMSSVSSWTFTPGVDYDFISRNEIPITKNQWCIFQNSNLNISEAELIKKCNDIPLSNKVILSPELINLSIKK